MRIARVQDYLGRRLLIENLSSYLTYEHSTMPEWEFVTAVAALADCDLLLDVNNVYVSSRNHGFDAQTYLDAIPRARVREMHLAGHTVRHLPDGDIFIDTHDAPVCDEVWALYQRAVARFGEAPALIEWDSRLPELDVLVSEARKADRLRTERHVAAA
jgi:uncharacterized protein (UPF0276 family)